MEETFFRWTQAITDAVNALTVLTGTGTPEGSEIASPGRLYVDTAAPQLYFKETGDGDTGWIAL